MKRTLTGLTIFIVLLGFVLLTKVSQFFFDAVILIALGYAVTEMVKLGKSKGYSLCLIPIIIITAAIYPMTYLLGIKGFLATAGIGFIFMFAWFVFDSKIDLNGFLFSVFIMVYPILLFSLSFILIYKPYNDKVVGMLPFLIAMGVSMCSDTFAFYFGSLIKGPKIFPKISPKKTYAGSIAGLLGGAVGGLIVYFLFEFLKLPLNAPLMFSEYLKHELIFYAFIGVAISAVSQVGDLAASRIKRSLDIKDFSHALGTHGGVMDRIDSILFSLVFMTVVMSFLI